MRSIVKGKKGFAQLVPLVLSIGIAIVLLGVMASISASTRDTLTNPATCGSNTTPLNGTGTNDDYYIPNLCSEGGGTDTNWTCHCAEYNITTKGLEGLEVLGGYWGIIVTIGAFVIILGALMQMFKGGERR